MVAGRSVREFVSGSVVLNTSSLLLSASEDFVYRLRLLKTALQSMCYLRSRQEDSRYLSYRVRSAEVVAEEESAGDEERAHSGRMVAVQVLGNDAGSSDRVSRMSWVDCRYGLTIQSSSIAEAEDIADVTAVVVAGGVMETSLAMLHATAAEIVVLAADLDIHRSLSLA